MLNTSESSKTFRKIITACFFSIMFVTMLNAGNGAVVDYIPSETGYVGQDDRQTSIYYHNNSLDQLWYGTNRWAVKYDLRNITQVDSLRLESVDIYFPQGGDNFNLLIYLDRLQPLDSLAVSYSNISVSQGWNNLSLPLADRFGSDVFWIVIEYQTNPNNRYMGASSIGGQNSYFWVPPENSVPGYFANMGESNIVSEFLVGVTGTLYFEDTGYDLELVSFEFMGNIRPAGNIHPKVRIRNNSPSSVSIADTLFVRLTNPGPDEPVWEADLLIDLTLPAGADTTIVFNAPQYVYRLLGTPAQYRLTADLQYEDDLYLLNNSISFSFDTFIFPRNKYLIENFVRSDHQPSMNILNAQQAMAADSLKFINCFFHPADGNYYSLGAALRKDFYSLGGYPFTITEGVERIAGYIAGYADSLTAGIEKVTPGKTFLSSIPEESEKHIDIEDLLLSLRFEVFNEGCYIFYSNLANLKMVFALLEKNVPGMPGSHLIYLHNYEAAGNLNLSYDNHHNFFWTLSLQTIETIHWDLIPENRSHFEIVYWLQDSQKKNIYHAGHWGLDEFDLVTGIEETDFESITKPDVNLYPNPLRQNEALQLHLSASRSLKEIKVSIYNVKGQLVKSISDDANGARATLKWNGITDSGQRAVSGVYLMRIETKDYSGKHNSQYRRFVILP